MQLTFLGTGGGAPTRSRNVAAIALTLPERGELYLLDCGEGTQQQCLRAPSVRLSQLSRVFITHLHGDHVFGLVGLLASRALAQGGTSPVALYGPAALEPYVRGILQSTGTYFGYPVTYHTVRPGVVFEDAQIVVECASVRHRCDAYAYAVQEKPQAGRFDVDAAKALNIPSGPVYGRLKRGETVTLGDGRVIDGRSLVGADRPGRRIVYSGDTAYCAEMVTLARDADLLVHESTFAESERDLAGRAHHSTASDAANVAKEAGVRQLVLTHVSPRYDADGGVGLDTLLSEARTVFADTEVAYDFLRIEVPRREAGEHSPDDE
ncbi:MAG: ribonuclease Z [Armatimonadetes bacterium]|nr:ribonuclease Z [Armatimonadota bacterium]